MFNLTKFNLGKFNASSNIELLTAVAEAVSKTTAKANIISRGQGTVAVISGTQAELVRRRIIDETMEISAESAVNIAFVRLISLASPEIIAISESLAETAGIFGYESLALPRLVLKPGDELIIDTDKLTITLNGQNVIDYLDEGDFFDLKQGLNALIFEDKASTRNLAVKILHKNRWL